MLAAAFGHGYPVAGGLSQTAVNDKAGARTPLALVFASITLAICLLFLTDLLENLPKVMLAAVVLVAVYRLVDIRDHRITMTDFRLCLARRPCSQASLCHCTQQPISDRPELTIARLRYSLGGDRPSQTAHHACFRTLFRDRG